MTYMGIEEIIHRDPDILGGTPVFKGTRVPIDSFLDHLKSGISLEEFLDDFPSVNRQMAEEFLELVKRVLLNDSAASVA